MYCVFLVLCTSFLGLATAGDEEKPNPSVVIGFKYGAIALACLVLMVLAIGLTYCCCKRSCKYDDTAIPMTDIDPPYSYGYTSFHTIEAAEAATKK